MAKMAEAAGHESFRDRARREYEERRAEGRLSPARQTCLTLDEKAGITVRFYLDMYAGILDSLICAIVQRPLFGS